MQHILNNFILLTPVHCSLWLAEHLQVHLCKSDSALAARMQQSYQSLKQTLHKSGKRNYRKRLYYINRPIKCLH